MHATSSILLSVLPCILLGSTAKAGNYSLKQDNVGSAFLDNFEWETIDDGDGGRTEYVEQSEALSSNLTYANNNTFIMRVDDTTQLTNSSEEGRKSIRIKSKDQYTTHLMIADINHLPVGCATWPALWEVDDDVGVQNGEFDIMEGVNGQTPGYTTLHTNSTCTVPSNRTQLGNATFNDCQSTAVQEGGDNGCAVASIYASSFGPVFNSNGGGWYVAERTEEDFSVWFWARNDSTVPDEVKNGDDSLSTANWSTPLAYFPASSSCNFDTNFKSLNIIFDIALCGSWAGNQFSESGCPGNCIDYVNSNASAFSDAYWDIASLKIYLPS
ncbi:glycoside hydrolase family 16 protein [Gelatoporia subvermispora B]|uniref:Glycoside hydrolase family 16 protein n=1 Tax=Ceriporiopsis subvermispora (strain B) TaxID=914234 RepID=M2QXW2_CERS8|nr:glycoside hydrolase family 16 protein [Gelatoporia subvermispora B]